MLLPLFDVDPNVNLKMPLAIPLDNVVNCYFIFALVLVGHILLQITFTIQSNSLWKKNIRLRMLPDKFASLSFSS